MRDVRPGGMTDRTIVAEIFETRLGRAATEAEIDRILDDYAMALEEELSPGPNFRLMPSVVDCLDFLTTAGPVLGIATGNIRKAADAKLRRAGLEDRFLFGGYGCDHPERAIIVERAVERALDHAPGATRETMIVVGDTPRDVAAARACGVQVVAVATGSYSRDELEACEPDATMDTLAELPAWHQNHGW